ncbi:helix-turn-helix domain-containing protein [Brevundimonas naejangsanensis]|uniref:helix-turn-helix domain-containing protein n=1 Tax=Brevundimonas naejangsanensis TaxID=588932 RepID=UPI0032094EA8
MARRAADFDVAIGARLQAARIASSKTQSDIGNLLGVTFQQVQKYEKGVNRLPGAHYPTLKQAIGFDPTDLIGGGDPKHNTAFDDFAATPGAKTLATAYLGMSHSRRRMINQLAITLSVDTQTEKV